VSAPRLLLVTPTFHGYWRAISSALQRRGYAVSSHLYDRRNAAGKIGEKLGRELPARLGLRSATTSDHTERAAKAVRSFRPDILLVVKGDILGADFWAAASGIPRRALWLYDELRRTSHTPVTLRAAGPIASYSPLDVADLRARGLESLHVPLAHDTDTDISARSAQSEVVFVGAKYPKRESILTTLYAAGVPVRAYGRDWSGHPIDRARTWRLRGSRLPTGRDLLRQDAYAVMAAATAALNIHGDQDGFTMRTFEVSGVGGLQLIDRADVTDHYEPGREVLVFDTAAEAIDLSRRALADPTWARRIREAGRARTLAEHTFDHRVTFLERLWA